MSRPVQVDSEGTALSQLMQIVDPHDKEILEVGCGDGRMTSLLHDRAKRVTAIDVDRSTVFRAGSTCEQAGFIVASGECLPFQIESFDLVIFTQSLHHMNSPKALQEAERVLKCNGRIVIMEPVMGTELENICSLFHDETVSRLDALYAIMDADLRIEHKNIVPTNWRFESKNELHQWLFDYYETPYDPTIASRVDRILGEKSEAVPLSIQEKLLFVSLGNEMEERARPAPFHMKNS